MQITECWCFNMYTIEITSNYTISEYEWVMEIKDNVDLTIRLKCSGLTRIDYKIMVF